MAWDNKVVWSEGMFLRPIHFQQLDRYVERYVEQRAGVLHGAAWGFTHLKLDNHLAALGKVALLEATGVFPDGTPFSIPDHDLPPPLEIDPLLKNTLVLLGIPIRRRHATEMTFDIEREGLARYRIDEFDTSDTHTPDPTPTPIQIGRLNWRFVSEKDVHQELITLGVVRIVECRDDKQLVFDDAYIPPVLDFRATGALSGLVREVLGLLHHRGEALAGRITEAGRGGVSEIADFLMLQVVNRYEPVLAQIGSAGAYHPREIHAVLVELAGELATFTHPRKRPPDFPTYRHDQLQPTFAPVIAELRRSLSMVLEQNAIAIPLEERKYGIRVGAIMDRSLLKTAAFVLAVNANIPNDELRRQFPTLVKIGSVEMIRQLVNVQLPGIQLRALPVAPRQLPYLAGYAYFELDKSSEYWAGLDESGGIALHISGELPGLDLQLWAVRA